jgi:hypothetical protein
MKKALLLIVVPALLAALAFAQTPAAGSNTDQTNIKGCLGGADGNYTVAEDNTGHVFKISASSVDLKPHVGHDVTLIGQRASAAGSAADTNSFAVTEVNMISEHCAAAAAAPAESAAAPAASSATPTGNAGAPSAAAAPAAAAPAATVSTPAETSAAPAPVTTEPVATVTPAETAVTPVTPVAPAPAAAEPAASMSAPAEIASTPPAASVHAKPASAGRRPSATPAAAATKAAAPAAATTSSEADSTPAAAATPPVATTSPDTASAPAAGATTPAKPVKTGSFAIFIAFAALVILLGILAPFLRRWRKRKMLEGTDAPNLSFTHDAKSDEEKSDPPVIRKAA